MNDQTKQTPEEWRVIYPDLLRRFCGFMEGYARGMADAKKTREEIKAINPADFFPLEIEAKKDALWEEYEDTLSVAIKEREQAKEILAELWNCAEKGHYYDIRNPEIKGV